MARIFLNYRRDDSSGHARRIYDRLSQHFGQENIFIDIDTIEPGLDFIEVIQNAVASCDVMLTVIGRQWLTSTDYLGNRRIDDPEDFLRFEIVTALTRKIRVIPVLVGGGSMPRITELPDVLQPLVRRQAIMVGDRFHPDVDRLIAALETVLGTANASAPPQLTPDVEVKIVQIFLCHASEDRIGVLDIYDRLKALGYKPWLDKKDLIPGQWWKQEIPKAIRASDIILIFLSKTSVAKQGYVQQEFKLAWEVLQEQPEGTIHTIPVRLDECSIPWQFGDIHWCNLFEPDGFDNLLRALETRRSSL